MRTAGRIRLSLLALLLILGGGGVAAGAEEQAPSPAASDRIAQMTEKLQQEMATENRARLPVVPKDVMLTPETMASMQRSIKAYYDYNANGFEHRRAVFEWQLFSSKIIFAIVVFLVGVGIYFSWIQFTASMEPRDKEARQGEAGGERPPTPTTTLEASAKGIKVSSPVLGVILLVISLAFFYLYLVYVYPIAEIF